MSGITGPTGVTGPVDDAAETARRWVEGATEHRGDSVGDTEVALAQAWALVSIAESLEKLTGALGGDGGHIDVRLIDALGDAVHGR